MERRQNERKRAKVDVYLACPGQSLHKYKTGNISGNGVFVQIEGFRCPKGIAVELVFVIHRNHVTRLHRRWATVVHVSRRGAGMRLYAHSRAPAKLAARPAAPANP